MRPNPKLIQAFDDLISEKELIAKTGFSRTRLFEFWKMGKIKKRSTINGRRPMYSKTEIAQLLNLQAQ